MQGLRTALYTTFYPGVEKYLAPWMRSVKEQSDPDFDLWIGLDQLSPEAAEDYIGCGLRANWITNEDQLSPASIRNCAFRMLTAHYQAIVLVDADDILEPTRVEAARRSLERHDVDGCALRIIDEGGADLGQVFQPLTSERPERCLPRHNIFGLSNSAYRANVLQGCLPIPPQCVLIDWLLATRAWCLGAQMAFDATPLMQYRQYPANTARVLAPFSTNQVLTATRRVLGHYECVLDSGWTLPFPQRDEIQLASSRARQFHAAVSASAERLEEYVAALNRLEPQYVWWWSVAHCELEKIWKN